MEGGTNDLIDRIAADPAFRITKGEINSHLNPSLYIGRCPSQVDEFLKDVIRPLIDRYYAGDVSSELKV